MQAIEILMDEHQNILRGMTVAEKMAERLDRGEAVPTADVASIVDFIRHYADDFHHMKEEDVLFKWMQEKGFPLDSGPLHCMLDEHNTGRNLVGSLADNLGAGLKDTRAAASDLRQFAGHLRQHIFKEDTVLYKMVEQMAEDDDDAELVKRYKSRCPDEKSIGIEQKYTVLMENLERVYR